MNAIDTLGHSGWDQSSVHGIEYLPFTVLSVSTAENTKPTTTATAETQ
jgi:hypothetical protein